ncbi:MAG: hypothetical protein UX87_C0044G0010 [Candidatus Amesbacteria bacterium GW2011_GWA1_47_16]|uniref:DUF5671 domain-containing protein n=5 Tax=Candidatus Amesiibacteriota TaxID=1752730 RepID=A0A1F4ZWA2_9BACT|nr:MAG: hypothetical protein UX87_C0044G0010 [Candidatus Amesbacteria bacterium GW2011_GWA1_47_16]KKU63148.1 MAG: hypothetical protein UX86_C0032G0011 [Candidatus Amesbacteria bacterium GW2011_GWC1_47_15]KKU97202.1 MAG: hypothetical protein UY28_C0026G0011 [Candidatus Amesbacteria bacterium GW2011_GWB1_48_13]OGC98856.1 MAG: hypothetical protein A2701_00750 [Candidatus Amesbacteria bacterium RIFCSPHIGHO2_01_FULL_47_34]OGD00648.1 MAG: hypothetical protein A2972_04245 [Candidatus Amesbacteria bact
MKKLFLSVVFLCLLMSSAPVSAADINIIDPASPYKTVQNLVPSRLVTGFINIFLGASGVVAFLYLLWGGIQWISSGGDKEGVEKARKRITHALIGLSVVFSAYALIYIIRVLFNIQTIGVNLKPI